MYLLGAIGNEVNFFFVRLGTCLRRHGCKVVLGRPIRQRPQDSCASSNVYEVFSNEGGGGCKEVEDGFGKAATSLGSWRAAAGVIFTFVIGKHSVSTSCTFLSLTLSHLPYRQDPVIRDTAT